MYIQDCKLSELVPPHTVRSSAHADALTESMVADGWVGRPLLGWWDEAQGVVRLFTGSHRYAAAKAAELEAVPVAFVEVTEGRLEGHGEDLLLDGVRVSDDSALLDLLRGEDPEAAELLEQG